MANYTREIDLLNSFNADVQQIKKAVLPILSEFRNLPEEFESQFSELVNATKGNDYNFITTTSGSFHLEKLVNNLRYIVELCADFETDVSEMKDDIARLENSGRGDRLEQRIRRLEKYIK